MPRLYLYVLLAGCLLAGGARAAEPEPLEQISAAAQDYVASHLGDGTKAQVVPLDRRLRMPACAGALETSGPAPNAGNAWLVAVHCSGPSLWTLYVPVRANQRRSVVVLTRSLPPGTPIPADAVVMQERDVSTLSYGYVGRLDDAVGKLLRHPVTAGATLTPDAVAAPASVKHGQEVTLLCEAGGFSVRADGRALADGASGDRIKAENLESHRIVEGVVHDNGVVEINP
jgi:flagellar basal body P-ring formation protein FlgA